MKALLGEDSLEPRGELPTRPRPLVPPPVSLASTGVFTCVFTPVFLDPHLAHTGRERCKGAWRVQEAVGLTQ